MHGACNSSVVFSSRPSDESRILQKLKTMCPFRKKRAWSILVWPTIESWKRSSFSILPSLHPVPTFDVPLAASTCWRLFDHGQILFSFKSRCGNRLKRGDFDRSSDALVLGVRDRSSGGGDGAGELVGVVELTIRQPDGSLPFNWPFPSPWRRPVSALLASCCTK